MNNNTNDLQRIKENEAREILEEVYGEKVYNLMYYSFPQVFGTTAGPFLKDGLFAGQAFTEFQIEVWTDGQYALIFSRGREIRTIKCEQPFTVDWYISQRKFS